jgi:phosphoribosylanthranilate isomerase
MLAALPVGRSLPMWVKICGLTQESAVAAALEAGADALGFVLAPSPRQLTPQQAARLAHAARGRALCVAVMRHPVQREVDEMLRELNPDVLQSDWADFQALALPAMLAHLPVVRAGSALPGQLPGRVLFEGATSGSGTLCDWGVAGALARRTELVLAGGLNATNVADGIEAVAPFGVDVSSGVEERLGIKSPAAITRFVAAARAAKASRGSR